MLHSSTSKLYRIFLYKLIKVKIFLILSFETTVHQQQRILKVHVKRNLSLSEIMVNVSRRLSS